jgi:cobalt-zinc-cadmium resistance protein CzcA
MARAAAALDAFPGIAFNFSQNIQDNVEEAMSGVKGENSLKLFGDDIGELSRLAPAIRDVMARVPGVDDLGVFKVTGQPNLVIAIDRQAAARYGLAASDLNAAVAAAVGGATATQVLEGDRRFDFVVRYKAEFRQDPQALRDILVSTADGGRVPLGQVAKVELNDGAFNIYRENGQRYIPIKFSVRGRDLASTVQDVQGRLATAIRLPDGYHLEWAGEYDSLKREQRRLMVVIPVSLAVIGVLLFLAFGSLRDALVVVATLPAGAAGGVVSLLVTRTPFSISAAVGFASVLGVGTLAALVFLSSIRAAERAGNGARATATGAKAGLRPVVMACLAAGLGLLPAAASHAIGVQAQQPLARVVVGGMVTTAIAIPLLMPVLAGLGMVSGRRAVTNQPGTSSD